MSRPSSGESACRRRMVDSRGGVGETMKDRVEIGRRFTLNEEAVRLAVVAHVRHAETRYDGLLIAGHDRSSARLEIEYDVEEVIAKWSPPK